MIKSENLPVSNHLNSAFGKHVRISLNHHRPIGTTALRIRSGTIMDIQLQDLSTTWQSELSRLRTITRLFRSFGRFTPVRRRERDAEAAPPVWSDVSIGLCPRIERDRRSFYVGSTPCREAIWRLDERLQALGFQRIASVVDEEQLH